MKAGSSYILTLALLVTQAVNVAAQRHSPPPPTPPPPTVTPPVSMPTAPAALTVPLPLGPPPGTIDLYARPDQFHSVTPPIVYPPFYVPGYGPGPYPPGMYPSGGYLTGPDSPYMVGAPPMPQGPRLQRGYLRFDTQPGTAQVLVDGFYKGIVDDFGMRGRPLELSVGSHHIELRASEYAPLSFDVDIVPNEVSRYRGDLQLLNPPQSPPSARNVSPKKYYVIPNCYAGDKPPIRALPSGCTVAQMRVVENK